MVGVSGNNHIPMFPGALNQALDQRRKIRDETKGTISKVKAHIKGDLIVPASSRMQPPSNLYPIP